MDRSKYLTTGELAELMHTTKNTLFHYEKIGLFAPEIVQGNDYRYYSIHQIEVLDAIIMLKELGMPLKEIRAFMDERSPEKLLTLLEKEERLMDAQIKKLKDRKRWMQEKSGKIKKYLETELAEVFISRQPMRYYLISTFDEPTDTVFAEKTTELIELYETMSGSIRYEIGYLQFGADIRRKIYDNYKNVVLVTAQKPKGTGYRCLPEGEYLSIYYKGNWEVIGSAYEKLLSYAGQHGILLAEEFLEVYAVDQLTAERAEDYVMEVTVQIL